MARSLYLLAYDVACPRRWYRTHRLLSGYRAAGQKSVFECWLTPAELHAINRQLTTVLAPAEDRLHVFRLDPRLPVRCFGIARTVERPFFLVA